MKSILNYIKSLFDFIFILFFIKLKKTNHHNNILFINTGYIGDLVISSALFENDQIFSNYENAYFLIDERFKDLFNDYNGIVKLLTVKSISYRYNLIYRVGFIKKLMCLNIKTVFNLTSVRPTWNDSLALCIRANNRYCYSNKWKSLKKVFYRTTENLYSKQPAEKLFNEYERINYAINFFSTNSLLKNHNYNGVFHINNHYPIFDIVIAPFSSNMNRDLQIEQIQKITKEFLKKRILILCNSQQKEKLIKFKKCKNVIISAGKYKLNELFSIVSKSKIFIGIDSGLTHIALKTDTKVIAIIGQGNYGRYLPKPNDNKTSYLFGKCEFVGCEWYCKREKTFCIEDITAEKIIHETRKALRDYENP